jgi:hypothetical protein
MAERVVVVCDVCGGTPAETVALRVRGGNLQKDLCPRHVSELLDGTRAPKRGRPRVATVRAGAPARRGRPPRVAQS